MKRCVRSSTLWPFVRAHELIYWDPGLECCFFRAQASPSRSDFPYPAPEYFTRITTSSADGAYINTNTTCVTFTDDETATEHKLARVFLAAEVEVLR